MKQVYLHMYDVYGNIEKCNADKTYEILIVFDDMIAYMVSNKRLNEFIKVENKHFSCFYYAFLFCCNKNIRLNYTLFYYENSKQTRASTNCIQLFIKYINFKD